VYRINYNKWESRMNVRSVVYQLVALIGFGAVTAPVVAQEYDVSPAVVPQAERDLAASKKIAGPAKNQGIKSVTPVGTLALGTEFPALAGRQLRARELLIEPGGVVAVHQHDQRPGLAYILEGEIVEHRSDQSKPLVRKQGEAAFENTGISHWWENKSAKPVRALVVDIVPVDVK
jgi:quercetin dioxygenase-like cupin family protein